MHIRINIYIQILIFSIYLVNNGAQAETVLKFVNKRPFIVLLKKPIIEV